MKLKNMPRINIADLPTRIHELKKLTKELRGPNLYIKRDDETGLTFGGNKVRKLEYIMGDAIKKEAEIIITSGGAQSNHARLTATAAVSLGLKPVLVITDEKPKHYNGSLKLDHLLGSELHFVSASPETSFLELVRQGETKVQELKELYEKNGKKAYIAPRGGKSVQGTAAYITATLEMYQQVINKQLKIDYIVTAVGSASTFGALILGNKLFNTGIKPIGISVAYDAEECKRRILEQVQEDKKHFGYNIEVSEDDIIVFDNYIGPGYSIPTPNGSEAIERLARTEGIFLDPSYTGKAMGGLISLIKEGYFSENDDILFLHTGGQPALFA